MAHEVEVTLNRGNIQAFLYGRGGPIVSAMGRTGREIQNVARRRVDTDTGALERSILVTVGSAPGFVYTTVHSSLRHALWHHQGTGVYGPTGRPIRPKRAQLLRFKPGKSPYPRQPGYRSPRPDRRRWVFTESVRGQVPNPFLVSALRDVVRVGRIRVFRGVRRR